MTKKLKYITVSIYAGMVLASCSNDLVFQSNDSDAISYEMTANSVTRAKNVYAPGDYVDFYVSAVVHEDTQSENFQTYFQNDEIKYTAGTSSTDGSTTAGTFTDQTGKRYWPDASTSLDFYAWHDCTDYTGIATQYTNGSGETVQVGDHEGKLVYNDDQTHHGQDSETTTENGLLYKVNNIQIKEVSNEQDDILYAYAPAQNRTTNAGYVKLNFRHALAKVDFLVKNQSPNLYVEVNNIYVNVSYTDGAMYFGYTTTETQYTNADNTNKVAYDYSENCSWTFQSTRELTQSDDPVLFRWPSYKTTDGNDGYFGYANGDAQYEATVKRSFMMIPQKLGTGFSLGYWFDDYVMLECRVYNIANPTEFQTKVAEIKASYETAISALTDDEAKEKKYCDMYAEIHGILDNYGAYPIIGTSSSFDKIYFMLEHTGTKQKEEGEGEAATNYVGWEAGKHYIYNIVFGGSGGVGKDSSTNDILTPVSLSLTVDDWGIGGSSTISM